MTGAALRFAAATLTIVPLSARRTDRAVAARAMLLAPLVGVALGAAAGGVLIGAEMAGLSPLVAATLAVGALALATRGLHLDGLADLADGLGSRRDALDALAVMKQSDIGPFGVVTVALTVTLQVATVAELVSAGVGFSGVLIAVTTGRLAVTLACRRGVPAARPDGLGAHVAGSLAPLAVVAVACAATAGAAALAPLDGIEAWRAAMAVAAGVLGALALERHAVRRLGGITGDVLGALVETATTVSLVVLATG